MRIKKNLIQLVESNYTHFKQIKKGFFAEALGQWRQLLIRLTSMQTLSRIQREKWWIPKPWVYNYMHGD